MITFRNHVPSKFSAANPPGTPVRLEFLDELEGAGLIQAGSFKVGGEELLQRSELVREGNIRKSEFAGNVLSLEPVPETVILNDDFSGPNRWTAMSVMGGAPELSIDDGKLVLEAAGPDQTVVAHELAMIGDGAINPEGSFQVAAVQVAGAADFMAGLVLSEPDLMLMDEPRQMRLYIGASGGTQIVAVNYADVWDVRARTFEYGELQTIAFGFDPAALEFTVNFWGLVRTLTLPAEYGGVKWVPFIGAMVSGEARMDFHWANLTTNAALPAGWKLDYEPAQDFEPGSRVSVELIISGGE